MDHPKLSAQKREVFGRKVKNLRQDGLIPGNIFGKGIKSLAIQLKEKEFTPVYRQAGQTGLADLLVESEKQIRPIMIQNVQTNPVKGDFVHVDLRQIILTEKVKASIPVELIGISPADSQKTGILVKVLPEIEVEALPTDLPEHFQVDVSKLEKVADAILVKDLKVDRQKVELKVDEKQIVVKIEPLAKEEVVTPPPTAAPEEGAAPAEGGEAGPAAAAEETKPEAPKGEEKAQTKSEEKKAA